LRIPLLGYLINTQRRYESHHALNSGGPQRYRKLEHSIPTLEGNGSFYVATTSKKRPKGLEIGTTSQYERLNENAGRNSYRDLPEKKRTL
jgi:hypothetical protein